VKPFLLADKAVVLKLVVGRAGIAAEVVVGFPEQNSEEVLEVLQIDLVVVLVEGNDLEEVLVKTAEALPIAAVAAEVDVEIDLAED
jgi:hypothetical protein